MATDKKDNKQMLWIILAIIIIIVIGVIIYFMVRNKSETYIKTYEEEFEDDEDEENISEEDYEINELLTNDYLFHSIENYMSDNYEIEMNAKKPETLHKDPKKFVTDSLSKLVNLGFKLRDRFDNSSQHSLEEVKNFGHKYGINREFIQHLIRHLKVTGISFLHQTMINAIHKNKENIRRLLKVCCHELADDVLYHLEYHNPQHKNSISRIENYEEQIQENNKSINKVFEINRKKRRELLHKLHKNIIKQENVIKELKNFLSEHKKDKNIENNRKIRELAKKVGICLDTLKEIVKIGNIEKFISGEITFETYEPDNFIENYKFSLKKAFKKVGGAIKGAAEKAGGAIKGAAEKAGGAIKDAAVKVGSAIEKVANDAIEFVKNLAGNIKKLIEEHIVNIINSVLGKYVHIDSESKIVTAKVTPLIDYLQNALIPVLTPIPVVGIAAVAALRAGALPIIFAEAILPKLNGIIEKNLKLPGGYKIEVKVECTGPAAAILKKFIKLDCYEEDNFDENVTEYLLKEHLKKVITYAKDNEKLEFDNENFEDKEKENENYKDENDYKKDESEYKKEISKNVENLLKHNFSNHEDYKEFKKILGKHINNKELIEIIQQICKGGKKYSDAIHLLAIMHKK